MKNVKVCETYYEPISLYRKVNEKSKSQMALLGYMRSDGYLRDPMYGGAFRLLQAMERYAGISIPVVKGKGDQEIVDIVEKAMLGRWDDFALSETEVKREIAKLEHDMEDAQGR